MGDQQAEARETATNDPGAVGLVHYETGAGPVVHPLPNYAAATLIDIYTACATPDRRETERNLDAVLRFAQFMKHEQG